MDIQISHKFIDEHLAKANGDFLKVYLYILRYAGARPSDEQIADALNLTERDVQRAIAYWKKEGVLDAEAERKEVDIARLSEDDEFRALLHALQNYIKRQFTAADAEIIGYMYDQLGFPSELIEYLFELCKQKGKTSLRYIEKVAQGWHERGIRTIEDAKKDTTIFATEIGTIQKHMGISSRELAKSELDYIDRWLRTWKMPSDIICEACDRTVLSTGKPSFAYADSILKSWYDAGIHTHSQLKEYDRTYAEGAQDKAASAAREKVASAAKGKTNGFHNFDERTNDDKNSGLDAEVMNNFNDLFK